jgi:hypothetical protein
LRGLREEVLMVYFKVPSQYSSGQIDKENSGSSQSGQSFSWYLRFEVNESAL